MPSSYCELIITCLSFIVIWLFSGLSDHNISYASYLFAICTCELIKCAKLKVTTKRVIVSNAAVDRSPHYACPEVIRVRKFNVIDGQTVLYFYFSCFQFLCNIILSSNPLLWNISILYCRRCFECVIMSSVNILGYEMVLLHEVDC